MSTKFITNNTPEASLSSLIKKDIKVCKSLDFLVGYFYFSGFCEIAEDITNIPMRILVGMNAGVNSNNFIYEYTVYDDNRSSEAKIKSRYFKSLKDIINKAEILDEEKYNKAFYVFSTKLENGTLEVRKTRESNHAKMYLFSLDKSLPGITNSRVVVGSSNLSLGGLSGRNEINVNLQDENDYDEAKRIFDELWKDSIPLISIENKDEFENEVLKKTRIKAELSPYLMYIKVLYEYYKVSEREIETPYEITKGTKFELMDLSYQIDAIKDGVEKLKKHSGVIIADVVGLGKSVVASCIARNIDRRVIVICPPSLIYNWEEYGKIFSLNIKVFSSGDIEKALKYTEGLKDLTIIVDEAHRFRNEDTESYTLLHRLCIGNYVLLLSATPFNNDPSDLFSLIKLFEIPTCSTIDTVGNLSNEISSLSKEYKGIKKALKKNEKNRELEKIAERLSVILDPVIIRRTRIDLEKIDKYKNDLLAQKIEFSTISDPVLLQYNLGGLEDLYISTLDKISGGKEDSSSFFIGARYMPLTYLQKELNEKTGQLEIRKDLVDKYSKRFGVKNFAPGQNNMADFMRLLLVRRFESSECSFKKTLEKIYSSIKKTKEYYERFGVVLIDKKSKAPDFEELNATDDPDLSLDDILDPIDDKNIWQVDGKDLEEKFINDLNHDLALIESLKSKWSKIDEDPKLEEMTKIIKNTIKNDKERKIIIFSEFKDTVDYLYDHFKDEGIRCLKYSSKNASSSLQEEIRLNFDAGVNEEKRKNDYDVLIATDAISEGYNLHRAGAIYNYDVPYNPTRVIQRVGRIDRINKKVFKKLYIYNFFPTVIGEKVSNTKKISTFKMKLFDKILSLDTKILTDEEDVNGYLNGKALEEESPDVKYRNELYYLERNEKEIYEKAISIPPRSSILRRGIKKEGNTSSSFSTKDDSELILFTSKGDSCRFSYVNSDYSVKNLSPRDALEIFEASKDEKSFSVTEKRFYSLYEKAKNDVNECESTELAQGNVKNAIKCLKELSFSKEDDYIDILLECVEKETLSRDEYKTICKICDSKDITPIEKIQQLKEIIPSSYLEAIQNKIKSLDEKPSIVVLSEELM